MPSLMSCFTDIRSTPLGSSSRSSGGTPGGEPPASTVRPLDTQVRPGGSEASRAFVEQRMSRPNYHGAATQQRYEVPSRATGPPPTCCPHQGRRLRTGVVIREEREESCHYADGLGRSPPRRSNLRRGSGPSRVSISAVLKKATRRVGPLHQRGARAGHKSERLGTPSHCTEG